VHMVVFKTAEGKTAYHQAESLDEALRFVERVRNHEGVSDAHLYRLTEIPLEIKTYFKVEIAPGTGASPAPAPPAEQGSEPVFHNLSQRL
jgi:hypothetical protein